MCSGRYGPRRVDDRTKPHPARGKSPHGETAGRRRRALRAGGLGILTERDVLEAIGADQDPNVELVGDHLTKDLVFAAPGWNMDQTAAAMVQGGFRHLVVLEGNEVVGILAMRDIVCSWLAIAASTAAAT
jgi:hypothetical protein